MYKRPIMSIIWSQCSCCAILAWSHHQLLSTLCLQEYCAKGWYDGKGILGPCERAATARESTFGYQRACLQYPAKIRKMQVLTYSSLPLEQQSCGRKPCFPHANIFQRASCAKTMVLHDILQLFRYYQVRVRQ